MAGAGGGGFLAVIAKTQNFRDKLSSIIQVLYILYMCMDILYKHLLFHGCSLFLFRRLTADLSYTLWRWIWKECRSYVLNIRKILTLEIESTLLSIGILGLFAEVLFSYM